MRSDVIREEREPIKRERSPIPPLDNLTHTEEEAAQWFESCKKTLREIGIDVDEKTSSILDMGAGSGALFEYLRAKGSNVRAIEAVHYSNTPQGIDIGTVEQMPYGSDVFDLALGRGLFDVKFDQDPDAMFQEINRVLRIGGIFYGILKPENTYSNSRYEKMATMHGFQSIPNTHGDYVILQTIKNDHAL